MTPHIARLGIAGLMAGFLLLPSPAAALTCTPVDAAIEHIGATAPIKKTIRLDAEQTARVVEWINQLPPETDMKLNLVVVLIHENGRVGLLSGNDGEICAADLIPENLLPALFKAIAGNRA